MKVRLSRAAWSALSLCPSHAYHLRIHKGSISILYYSHLHKCAIHSSFFPSLRLLKGAKIYRHWGWQSLFGITDSKNQKDCCDCLVQPLHFINKAPKPFRERTHLWCIPLMTPGDPYWKMPGFRDSCSTRKSCKQVTFWLHFSWYIFF